MKNVIEIRNTFLNFFEKNGHKKVKSSSLIPHNDPTMMFVNSGMVQFKNVFTGEEVRDYSRATSSQKCVRAGGKHNDLDNVGYTARHHTFFEMLGNFSFGDYFKEQAIAYAWDLLTKDFSLPKEKLYVTVYHTDDEAIKLWKKIANLGDDRIISINTNDNFWSMGDTGPCGPCTEIFYDHGEKVPGGLPGTAEQDGDRYIEIWNMVFMQFEQLKDGSRIELPKKSIDTGMGLERVAAVLEGVHNNYDIDIFRDLISYSEDLTKTKSEGEAKFSHRIIADHLRSCSFLIADGVMPSNEGRGYVLRRVLRRAMRHIHQLGSKEPLMYKLLPKLVSLMGDAYPELRQRESFIADILHQEEQRFKTTLDRGLKFLEEEAKTFKSGDKLKGDVAFKLYDTYGFPLDLTEDILRKQNITVDKDEFDQNMQVQRERARQSWVGSGENKTDKIWFDILAKHGPTEFLGYSNEVLEGKIIAIVKDGVIVEEAVSGDKCYILTSQSPFYAESGGQMGDIGEITSNKAIATVNDTKKFLGKLTAHLCEIKGGKIIIDDSVRLVINGDNRQRLKAGHTATHILHAVLRDYLGDHVTQKGSLVSADKLRFDFSHQKSLTEEDIIIIEDKINNIILENTLVTTKLMETDEAISIGAMALFGEKYDSEVRVVSLENKNNINFSIELCGGTHVNQTGDIGLFKIISESAIAAGVRRIEAITHKMVISQLRECNDFEQNLSAILKVSKGELQNKILQLNEQKRELEKKLQNFEKGKLVFTKEQVSSEVSEMSSAKLLVKCWENIDPKLLRSSSEDLIKNFDDLVLVYAANNNDKISIVVAVSKAIAKNYKAGNIIKICTEFLGGTGGGSDEFAQGGGNLINKLPLLKDELLNKINY